jgi:glycosyltransferase involved in cell wall biosynthesis
MVHRVGSSRLAGLRTRFASAPTKTSGSATVQSTGAGILRRAARTLHDLTWKKLYWPDYAAIWVSPAVTEAARILKSDSGFVLITVSLPFAAHLAGLRLKKRFPALRWLVDIGDPFSFMHENPTNNHLLYGRLNIVAERRVLEMSDTVSVTTRGTLDRYVQHFPFVVNKIFEIPPLVHIPDRIEAGPAAVGEGDRLVFVGTLHRNIRSPDRLLRLFLGMAGRAPGNIELHFYGNFSECADSFKKLPESARRIVHLHGVVDRSDALAAMASASALVNIGNDTRYQLPSKLVEYAAMGKPIINVVSFPNDSSIEFLSSLPCVFNVVGTAAGQRSTAEAVLGFLGMPRSPEGCRPDARWLERFSVDRIARDYETRLTLEPRKSELQ